MIIDFVSLFFGCLIGSGSVLAGMIVSMTPVLNYEGAMAMIQGRIGMLVDLLTLVDDLSQKDAEGIEQSLIKQIVDQQEVFEQLVNSHKAINLGYRILQFGKQQPGVHYGLANADPEVIEKIKRFKFRRELGKEEE